MSFGPDTSELEADLADVERLLRNLNTDDTLSAAERALSGTYYAHKRDRIRSIIEWRSKKPQSEMNDGVDASPPTPQGMRAGDGGRLGVGGLDRITVTGESWKAITPPALIHSVIHIRQDFERLSGAHHRNFENLCFKDIHPLRPRQIEPAVFRKYFDACVEALSRIVVHSFGRLLDTALAQDGTIGAAAVQWAALHLRDLIELESRAVDLCIKSACDRPQYDLGSLDHKSAWEVFSRKDWRAPKWLRMQPNGNTHYDASIAWERLGEEDTRSLLKALRKNRWSLTLEETLEQLVGSAHEVLAKRRPQTTGSFPKEEPAAAKPQKNDETPIPSLSQAEIRGRRRAALVGQLISELNALRPHLQVPDDDYPILRDSHPDYSAFKICNKHPGAVKWIKLVGERKHVNTLAYELAAAEFNVSAATIATEWKRHKPKPKRKLGLRT